MVKGRVEAFSDGVIAIIITIMVLELKAPAGVALADLKPLAPVFLSYVLSFVYVGIYWNNHHHMFQGVRSVNGTVLWANLHLLFWLSTIPFVTSWMGQNPLATAPVALYGAVLFMSAIAFAILSDVLVRHEGADSTLAKAIGRDFKGRISPVLYALGIALAFVEPIVSLAIYVGVALVWLIPDRRVERQLDMH
jgi:uncharacterized membrane protein